MHGRHPVPGRSRMSNDAPGYAELHAISNFTFLKGASHPEELVRRAAELGYAALALTDECSLAGVVRAHRAARETGLALIVGTELALDSSTRVVLIATDRAAYGRLSALITRARRNADKGTYRLETGHLDEGLEGCLALLISGSRTFAVRLAERFPGRLWLAVTLHHGPDDAGALAARRHLAGQLGLPLVAVGGVRMHERARRPLADTLSAIRLGCRMSELGFEIPASAECHLRSRPRLARIYPRALLEESVSLASRCRFSLDELRYEYPEELVPHGLSPREYLRRVTEEGIRSRWPEGESPKVRAQIEHELALIAELGYEPYFLTVHDIVRYARGRGILCQGRGSAANSAVCYCLGITEVDPGRMSTLFERFVSRERNEPPDIDVDFEHERREEVIQYIYGKYGRERAAIAATVITYRPRSAVRDVGKALGLEPAQVDRLAKNLSWWDSRQALGERLRELGFDPGSRICVHLVRLVEQLVTFPRHLSQHTGGFVISRGPLSALVPVENAAMPERTVIQWDKDDLEALGLLKVDVLALGMLTAIRKSFDLIAAYRGRQLTMAGIPKEDPVVYEMIGQADTVGVFQIESRAQMAMLPRLRPRKFYDLVIEVAIVRPGPIQGGMVHPYLRRRQGLEPKDYPSSAVREVLERTLGVPIFQEQVMQLAVVAAGFSPGEADRLRRAMAALAPARRPRALRAQADRRHEGARLYGGVRKSDLSPDRRLRGVRLPGVAFGELRAARLRVGMAQAPRAGRLHLRVAQQPADGLLRAGPVGAGRPPSRGRGAGCRRALQRVGLPSRARWRRRARAPPRLSHGQGVIGAERGAHRRGPRVARGRRRGLRVRRGSGPAGRAGARGSAAPRPRRRSRPSRRPPPSGALGGRRGWKSPRRCFPTRVFRRRPRCCARRAKARTLSPTTATSVSASGAIPWRCCAGASIRSDCAVQWIYAPPRTASRLTPPASSSVASAPPPRAGSFS